MRDRRVELIRAIEEKRGSRVLCYVTSDRPGLASQISGDVVSIVHEHLRLFLKGEAKSLDLFLYSRGGDSNVPWTLVSMFREYLRMGSFNVLVPYRAHSAATVIALGADEIVMTKKGELGPIDVTIAAGPYNPVNDVLKSPLPISVEDVNGYFDLLETVGCEQSEQKMGAFERLTDRVHPLALGMVRRILRQTELVTQRLLNNRKSPFAEEVNKKIARKLATEIFSHSHSISRTEAMDELELSQIKLAEDLGIDDLMWSLYEEYREVFSFEDPFVPEQSLIRSGQLEETLKDLPIACVESADRFDCCYQSLRVRRIKQIPPQVTLTLQNCNLPAINLPAQLQQLLNPQQLAQIVQAAVQSAAAAVLGVAAEQAAQELLKALPSAGFERIVIEAGWRKES